MDKKELTKEIDSELEKIAIKLIGDIIDDVRNEMVHKENDIDGCLLGLEILSSIYSSFKGTDLDNLCQIEYIYRNGTIYDLAEFLNKWNEVNIN